MSLLLQLRTALLFPQNERLHPQTLNGDKPCLPSCQIRVTAWSKAAKVVGGDRQQCG